MDMKPIQWIIATAIAAVCMIGYVHSYVYPRTEGEKLEKSIDKILTQIEDRLNRIDGRLDNINDKIQPGYRR